ncbi:hypothetical protein QYE76_002239 [Lolium multiflorum]|uniref:Uncharacterized protein n=1 Tax=Lolium multiflorum TaxID=4521 RepID=A0AAD8RMY1_LOLMU|nr:hypothetical protein QYE76_002239 [Lolium multiflorum]
MDSVFLHRRNPTLKEPYTNVPPWNRHVLEVSWSRSVRLDKMAVMAPGDNPNTDGIHVVESIAVTIASCRMLAARARPAANLAALVGRGRPCRVLAGGG